MADLVAQKLFMTSVASPPRRALGNLTNDNKARLRPYCLPLLRSADETRCGLAIVGPCCAS